MPQCAPSHKDWHQLSKLLSPSIISFKYFWKNKMNRKEKKSLNGWNLFLNKNML